MMLHVPEVLNAGEVAECRRALDGAEWIDGRATVGEQGARVKRNRQLADASPVARAWGERILLALGRHALYVSAALPLRTVPPLFNRYEGGEQYGAHIDGALRMLPGAGPAAPQWLRTDLSCTLFLCDPAEYDGGELIVTDTYGEHEVKLPAGDLILYPSSSLHRVEPVTRGCRQAAFFWVQSMVRGDTERSMLHELDMHIQRLRGQLGETAETIGLTGHYHNLLRRWAET